MASVSLLYTFPQVLCVLWNSFLSKVPFFSYIKMSMEQSHKTWFTTLYYVNWKKQQKPWGQFLNILKRNLNKKTGNCSHRFRQRQREEYKMRLLSSQAILNTVLLLWDLCCGLQEACIAIAHLAHIFSGCQAISDLVIENSIFFF